MSQPKEELVNNMEKFTMIYDDTISVITKTKSTREDISAAGVNLKCLRPRPFNKMPEKNVETPKWGKLCLRFHIINMQPELPEIFQCSP